MGAGTGFSQAGGGGGGGGTITGSGTVNFAAKFTGGTAIGNSIIFDNGTAVGISTVTPLALLHVNGAGVGTSMFGNFSDNIGGWYHAATVTAGNGFLFAAAGSTNDSTLYRVQILGGSGGDIRLFNAAGVIKVALKGQAGVNHLVVENDLGTGGLEVQADGTTIAYKKLGVGIAIPTAKLHVIGETADATTYALKIQDVSLNLNFYVQNDGAVSSRLGYWIAGNRILHQQGHVTSIYCGVNTGANAGALASFNVGLGFNALNANTGGVANVAIGFNALGNYQGDRTVAIGQASLSSNITGIGNTAIGDVTLNNATGDENTALGFVTGSGITTGGYNTFLGSRSGAVTQLATVSHSIAIGCYTHTTANNQCVIGEQQGFAHISEFVLGYGPDQPSFTTGDTMVRPTNVSAGVTDIANDYNIIYAGGRGTGTGKGSDIIFKIAPAGATGSTQNALLEALRIKYTGVINISNIPTSAAGLVAGDIWSNLGVLTIV
jgi:hypothetical protein